MNLPGVEAVSGDITDPTVIDLFADSKNIDEFWHIAGLTEFHESRRPQLERVNIEGTRHAVTLAQQWGVNRFFHISTAFVAGICDGPVMEDGLVPNPVFRNPYEETKYRGEELVRAARLPWIIIRPSILMGDSQTGEADSDKMAYGVCKSYFMVGSWVRRENSEENGSELRNYVIKGLREVEKNCICIDDVVALLLSARSHGSVGATYHYRHPSPSTVGEVTDAMREVCDTPFISLHDDWPDESDRKQRFLAKACRIYEPYMTGSDPSFDLTNTLSVQPDYGPAVLSPDLLLHLFRVYVADLRKRKQAAAETTLDLSRLDVVRRYGSFALAYGSMSRQFRTFTATGTEGYIGYALVDKTAMMVGDPVASRPDVLLAEFVRWCDRENLRLCALQITRHSAAVLRQLGCSVNKLGIETSIDLGRFDPELRGTAYFKLRYSQRIAERFGIGVREQRLSERTQHELRSLFADWLDRKKNREELLLLLRPPSFEPEPDVRHFLAEVNGRLIATVFFVPMYSDGRIEGYYADVERYNADGMKLPAGFNLMKLIECQAAKVFQREGVKVIALGMSPLYQVGESEFNDNPELSLLFSQLFEESNLYAFRGIALHKREYPSRIEHDVFIATRSHTAAEEVLDLLKGVGLLGDH